MQERYIASADLGTSKIAITVAKVCGEDVQIIYYKETPSDGVRYSSIFNPKRASDALKQATMNAQKELGIEIRQLAVGLPRYSVHQETASARIERPNPESCITQEEIDALKSMALESYPLNDSEKEVIYGAVAQSFSTEDIFQGSEHDIVGATSEYVEGNFKIFVGDQKAMNNVDVTLNQAGIALAGKYFLPDAVAQAVLTDEEKENGVALVEIGAGVTSMCIYQGHILRHFSTIPFGGRSITTDIKYECGFKEVLAENIKLAFGACMPEKLQSMNEKIIQVTDEENGTFGQKLPVKYLSEIITCRASEIIEAILFLIQESGYAEKLRSGIVLTGGGANLTNLQGLVKEMSGYRVRMGFPRGRKFSAEGCDGISETDATASVGMILMAKKDVNLNCTSEPRPKEDITAPDEEQVSVEEPATYEGTVFGNSGKTETKEIQKKKKREKESVSIKNVIWNKAKNRISEALDGTVELFGEMYDKSN